MTVSPAGQKVFFQLHESGSMKEIALDAKSLHILRKHLGDLLSITPGRDLSAVKMPTEEERLEQQLRDAKTALFWHKYPEQQGG